jgi:hypothetical protein
MARETRSEKILKLASRWPEHAALALRAVESGQSFSSFQRDLIEEIGHRASGVEVGDGSTAAWRRAAADLLILRGTGRIVGARSATEEAQRARAAEEAESVCHGGGNLLRGIAERASRHVRANQFGDRDFESRAFASTSDFPAIVHDALNKMVAARFAEQEKSYESVANVIRVPDFRPSHILKWHLPNFSPVQDGIPLAEALPADSRQSIQPGSYAESIAIGRATFHNDDAGSLAAMAAAVAEAAARTIADTVWAHVLSNPVMLEDSVALFATTHTSGANTVAAALDQDGLSAVIGLLRSQKPAVASGATGTAMNLRPQVLLVPTASEGDAKAAIGAWPSADTLRIVVEPRLTPATSWYVVAPRGPGLTIATLSGILDPVLTEATRSPMGVTWAAILDFGVAVVDHRGWARGTA